MVVLLESSLDASELGFPSLRVLRVLAYTSQSTADVQFVLRRRK